MKTNATESVHVYVDHLAEGQEDTMPEDNSRVGRRRARRAKRVATSDELERVLYLRAQRATESRYPL